MLEKEELTILVLDGSSSMEKEDVVDKEGKIWQRAAAVEDAVKGFLGHLEKTKIPHERWLAVITYDHRAELLIGPTKLTDWAIRDEKGMLKIPISIGFPQELKELKLLDRHGGSTAIGTALRLAQKEAEFWLSGQEREDVPRYVNILLLTDGEEEQNSDPEGVAAEIKKKHGKPKGTLQRLEVMIATAAFGPDVLQYRRTLEKMSTPVITPEGERYPYSQAAPMGAILKSWLIATADAAAVGPQDNR
jgi:hypothetical protein